jgi:hypothetical protein
MDTPPAEVLAQAEAVRAPFPRGIESEYTSLPSSLGLMGGEEGASQVKGAGAAPYTLAVVARNISAAIIRRV